jgi:uncharacterized membrane protein
MSEIVNQSLQKIANGTGIIFIGIIIGMLLAFLWKVNMQKQKLIKDKPSID